MTTMETTMEAQPNVRYEGGSAGTEIWGMTQANFLIAIPGRHAKEAAVNLTDSAALWLAKELGQVDSKEFREETARRIGVAFFSNVVAGGFAVESIVIASEGFLEDHPELLVQLRTADPKA